MRPHPHARRFVLDRTADLTGVSGTGIVAEGIEFSDGSVAMRWIGDLSSIVIHASIDNVTAIHGHNGFTTVRWVE